MKKFIFFIFVICTYISPFTAWSACNSIYEKTNGDQYLESQFSFMNKPAYLQCGGDEQTSCKQDDIVAGNDGYLYKCDINRWKKVNDDEIKECDSVTEIYTAKNKNYPIAKEQHRPSIYLYTKNTTSEKISEYCKVSSKFVIQNWDLEFATCDGKEDGVPSGTCSVNAVVGGENGLLYKCTSNGWTQKKEDIPNCVNQRNAPKNKKFQYFYDDATAKSSGCNYAIQNYCINQVNAPDSTTSSTTGGSKAEAIFEEELDITGDPEYECTKSGGRDYDPAYGCICDTENDHLVQDTRTYNKIEYSICKCMNGYKRKETGTDKTGNMVYLATGECIPTNDYETKQVPNTEKYRQDAENAYRNEYDNAQSWANKGITAGSTLLTGEGAMKAAQALAEQKADRDAEIEMAEWISKMGCEYGNGQQVNFGEEETLPGGNELTQYYAEYKQLADKLKATKAALNLRPGIESEVLYDRAETGLYQYANAERQSGGFTSLSRALMNPEGTDAEQWNAQKAEVTKDLTTGTLLTAGGLATGAIGNYFVNRNHEPTKLQQSIDKVVVEVEEKLPAFTYTPAPVNITYQEPKTEIYLEENGGRAPIPTLSELEPKQNALTLNGDTTFDRNKATLKDTTKINTFVDRLNTEVLAPMTTNQEISINIMGHTDRTGNDKINIPLSLERARSVEKHIKKRLPPNISNKIRYEPTGVGSRDCSKNYCDGKDDCELCRKVVVTIEDITKTQE